VLQQVMAKREIRAVQDSSSTLGGSVRLLMKGYLFVATGWRRVGNAFTEIGLSTGVLLPTGMCFTFTVKD